MFRRQQQFSAVAQRAVVSHHQQHQHLLQRARRVRSTTTSTVSSALLSVCTAAFLTTPGVLASLAAADPYCASPTMASTTSSDVVNIDAAPLPSFFLGHGGGPSFFMDHRGRMPMALMDKHSDFAKWLRSFWRDQLSSTERSQVKALLVVSAHWESTARDGFGFGVLTTPNEEETSTVASTERGLLFDYGGFPDFTYELEWSARSSPALEGRVREVLHAAKLKTFDEPRRKYDHGVFVPLLLVRPDPKDDLPILQVSLDSRLDAGAHVALGRALSVLRHEGFLVVGSGFATHNIGEAMSGSSYKPEWFDPFTNWLRETLTDANVSPTERQKRLLEWAKAPGARGAHPREEHLLPLHVAAGAAASSDSPDALPAGEVIFDAEAKGMSLLCFRFR